MPLALHLCAIPMDYVDDLVWLEEYAALRRVSEEVPVVLLQCAVSVLVKMQVCRLTPKNWVTGTESCHKTSTSCIYIKCDLINKEDIVASHEP